jgi:hypothetical protein
MVTRKALVRPIFRRVPHFPQGSKRTKHIARDVVRTLCERRIRDRRHTSQATSSRVKNWRKKCQPHKNDAIRFAHEVVGCCLAQWRRSKLSSLQGLRESRHRPFRCARAPSVVRAYAAISVWEKFRCRFLGSGDGEGFAFGVSLIEQARCA